eukprot:GHRR01037197.1.p1 GENE.GHRR01037197.1~~GHRR01037197.1.p1  ORF type:complete len:126 (+),score=20.05 GHRR01037197.1:53-430(+)
MVIADVCFVGQLQQGHCRDKQLALMLHHECLTSHAAHCSKHHLTTQGNLHVDKWECHLLQHLLAMPLIFFDVQGPVTTGILRQAVALGSSKVGLQQQKNASLKYTLHTPTVNSSTTNTQATWPAH